MRLRVRAWAARLVRLRVRAWAARLVRLRVRVVTPEGQCIQGVALQG